MNIKRHLPTIAIVMFLLAATDVFVDRNWVKATVLIAVGVCCAVATLWMGRQE
jgi:hypothetical protein